MSQYIAFLRAINVGGHAIVKMNDLRDAFTAAGCEGARTYIQSGNVVFASSETRTALRERLRGQLRELLGHEPGILLRTVREMETLVRSEPFAGVEASSEG